MPNSKIALVLCPCWSNLCPPLGISYLSSSLKKKGYNAQCFDVNVELYDLLKNNDKNYWDFSEHYNWGNYEDFQRLLPLIKDCLDDNVRKIISWGADIIGFTVFYTSTFASLYMAQKIKELDPGKKIIFGGVECYKEPKDFRFLKSGVVDAVVVGEGEATLIELLDRYFKNGKFIAIEGVVTKIGDDFAYGGFREELADLNDLPIPDFSNFQISKYKGNTLPLLTSRGCVARCAFCGEVKYWRKFRYRKAENVIEEIKHGVSRYGVDNFHINDSLINGSLNELSKLADLIIDNKLTISWGGYARIHKGMNQDFFRKLKKAGCHFLSYGIESGSQKVVNDMNKNILLKDAEKNLSDTVNVGIETHVNWIVGFPTESWIDFAKSLLFIKRNKRNISNLNPGQVPCGILPDSYLSQYPEKFNIAKKTFRNDWRTRFYTNTIGDRRLRLKVLRKFLSFSGIQHT